MIKVLWWIGFTFLPYLCLAQPLGKRLDSLLSDPMLRTSEVGITVYDLTAGKSLYRYQDRKLYRPASVEKIVTGVTALARLGAESTFNTDLKMKGVVQNDTLHGSLYVVGGFDPLFMEEDMDSLVQSLVDWGIRYVTDSLVADISMTDSLYWGSGWSWDDAPFEFQPYLSPLQLNRGCVKVTALPGPTGEAPLVEYSPVSSYYQFENQAVSRVPQAGRFKVTRNWMEQGNRILLKGNVERATSKYVSMHRGDAFFMQVLKERLLSKGIEVPQEVYLTDPVAVIDSLPSLYVVRRPLKKVLKEAMKESDNLCAESMFYQLASRCMERSRVGAEEGTKVIEQFIKEELALNPNDYRIEDGSGVSLYNYISPQLLMAYLKYAYARPELFASLYDALPIAGIDGTLEHRMKKTPAYRKVRAKTGSLTGVSSLAGYVKAANGHQLAFVIINQNVLKLSKARRFQDLLCTLLSQYQ